MSELNILMQCSNYYAPFCGVTLQSLLQNNKEIGCINIFLISDKIDNGNLSKFYSLAQKFERNISIIDGSKIEAMLVASGVKKYHHSYTTYYKLFTSRFIQEDFEKILYLDSDIIINKSLKELMEVDISKHTLAMTLDWMNETYKKKLRFTGKYYNGGVILFNLRKWRAEKWEEQVLNYLRYTQNNYLYADQDLLNIVLNGKIARLDMKWNINTDFLNIKQFDAIKSIYGIRDYYSEEEFEEAISNPVIFHCCAGATVSRPWFLHSRHPLESLWNAYLLESPWKAYIKENEKTSLLHKIQHVLYSFLPQRTFAMVNRVCTNGILYLRQLKWR